MWKWINRYSGALMVIILFLGFIYALFTVERTIINFDEANYDRVNVEKLSGQTAYFERTVTGNPNSTRGARIFLGSVRENGCIQIRDINKGGWTKIYTLDGKIVSESGACDIGEYEVEIDPDPLKLK